MLPPRSAGILLVTILFEYIGLGLTSNLTDLDLRKEYENDIAHFDFNKSEPVTEKCLAFFKEYTKYAAEFSRCELKYAEPFRMCYNCVKQYVITSAAYNDLVTNNDLVECRIKYMKSDRVQIFPIVQKNIENIWTEAACSGCFEDLTINHTTKEVNFHRPYGIRKFMELYNSLSLCMNTSLDNWATPAMNMVEDVCTVCLHNYTVLNEHYQNMSGQFDSNICMDIVDRMNYTRLIWSHNFNCSCRSSEPVAVIIITLIIGSAPLFFYIILRVTGKEKKKKILKQKRLNASSQYSASQGLWRPNEYRDYQSLRTT